jgi:hypothetical protein
VTERVGVCVCVRGLAGGSGGDGGGGSHARAMVLVDTRAVKRQDVWVSYASHECNLPLEIFACERIKIQWHLENLHRNRNVPPVRTSHHLAARGPEIVSRTRVRRLTLVSVVVVMVQTINASSN